MDKITEILSMYKKLGIRFESDVNTEKSEAIKGKMGPILKFQNTISDGRIGFFRQRGTGDCYLLASLVAISKTKNGAEILKNNIKKNKNGSYTITLPGAIAVKKDYAKDGKKCYITGTYTITGSDIAKARKGNKYSSGDIDVLLYELAFEKYRKEVMKTNKENGQESEYGLAGQYIGGGTFASPLDGGQTNDATFILTGKKSKNYYISANKVQSVNSESIKGIDVVDGNLSKLGTKRYLDLMSKNPGRYAMTFSIKIDDGKGKEEYHAIAITRVDKDRVYFTNSWNTKKEFSMSKEDFFNVAYDINVTDFGKPSLGENVINQTYNLWGNFIDNISYVFS